MGCWATNIARRVGCERKRPAIRARGRWDADALRDVVREYALETLSDADAVLVIDETGFLKQGKASCGVARQYTGSAGKITNCQMGLFPSCGGGPGQASLEGAFFCQKKGRGERRGWRGVQGRKN